GEGPTDQAMCGRFVGRTTSFLSAGRGYGRAPVGGQKSAVRPTGLWLVDTVRRPPRQRRFGCEGPTRLGDVRPIRRADNVVPVRRARLRPGAGRRTEKRCPPYGVRSVAFRPPFSQR